MILCAWAVRSACAPRTAHSLLLSCPVLPPLPHPQTIKAYSPEVRASLDPSVKGGIEYGMGAQAHRRHR